MLEIKVYINHQYIPMSSIINISDRDIISFEFSSMNLEYITTRQFDLILEDYQIPLVISEDGLILRTQDNNLFRESFGYSSVRLFIDDEFNREIVFNVSTNEKRFNSIKGMMSYLLKNNERILDVCFARTKYTAKNDGTYEASYDSMIDLAEKIVETIESKKNIFSKVLRHRLKLILENVNESNYYNINPYHVIENLDQLYQGYSPNSLQINGKIYSLDNIQRENHVDSYELVENHILIGGLMSIKETMLDILDSVDEDLSNIAYDKEYEMIRPYTKQGNYHIEDLYVQLTTEGMTKRINSILNNIEEILHILKKDFGVSFQGYIEPNLTPYARKSSFYLAVYTSLANWYALGSPNIGIDDDLTKIRSTSKIYEFFALYKLIDKLHGSGWEVIKSVEDSHFKRFIPSMVEFRKNETVLTVYYEKKVFGFTEHTKHNDLVALDKSYTKGNYNYYNPDFILVKKKEDIINYFIFDAKYSSTRTLQQFKVLDKLFEKYYVNLAIYDDVNKLLEKKPIKCVQAIHPFGKQKLNKWSSKLPTVIPKVSSIILSEKEDSLNEIIDLIDTI